MDDSVDPLLIKQHPPARALIRMMPLSMSGTVTASTRPLSGRPLARVKGNQSVAAEILGVSLVTVWNRMKRLGISYKRQIESPLPESG